MDGGERQRPLLKLRTALLALVTAALLVAWFLMLRPESLGGPATYVMVDGQSMEPALGSGDLAVVRQQDDYRPGDVVAFRVPEGQPGEGGMVIHRIVGEAPDGFVTQGDNREAPDSWRPTADDIVGGVWFSVPAGGHFVYLLRQPLALGAVVGGVGTLLVLSGGPGKPPRSSDTSRSRPAGACRRDPPGTRLILGLVLVGALTRAVELLRRRDRGTPG